MENKVEKEPTQKDINEFLIWCAEIDLEALKKSKE